jgi:N-acetylglucosamine-6-phosphate deacetylase
MEGERGRVAPGYVADMVLLSPDLRVQTTIASGEVVYSAA